MSEAVALKAREDGSNVRKVGITDIESEALRGLDLAGKLELQEHFVELRAKGWSLRKIERKIKVSKSALANWDRELEGEIASLKAIELEALYERCFLAKEARIKLLGQQLRRIQRELKSRDLEDVSTEKLLEMQLKYLDGLLGEFVGTRPLSDAEIDELRALA